MVNQLTPMIFTFLKELKTTYTGSSYYFKLFGDITRTVVLAWIVYLSGDSELLGYLCVGVPLLAVWTGVIAMGGWSLSSELLGRTLDFILISRSPMPMVLFSKTVAQIVYEMMSAFITLITILLVARGLPEVGKRRRGLPLN